MPNSTYVNFAIANQLMFSQQSGEFITLEADLNKLLAVASVNIYNVFEGSGNSFCRHRTEKAMTAGTVAGITKPRINNFYWEPFILCRCDLFQDKYHPVFLREFLMCM